MAYVDGTADEAVVRHVRQCPACARRAEELAQLQAALTASLYRHSCPTSDRLLAYRYGGLAGGERLVVAQHLQQCPHCARELAALRRAERQGPGEWLRAAIERVEAALATPQMQAVGVRQVPPGSRSTPQVYRAEEIEIIVHQRPGRTHPHRRDLVGLIHVAGRTPEAIGQAQVELYRGEGLIAIEPVNPRGQFALDALEAGGYDLCLVWGRREIQLKGIQVQ